MKIEPHEHLPPGISNEMFHNDLQRSRCSTLYRFMRLAGYTPGELLMRYYLTELGSIAGVEVLPQSLLDYRTLATQRLASREIIARYAPLASSGSA